MKDRFTTNIYTAFEDRYGILKEFSRKNRRNPTEAERCLWQMLRNNALGVKFRRQHPIEDYIADFICLDKKLILEIDGGYHYCEEQKEEDQTRTSNLEKMGFRVLRFTNEQILCDPDKTLQTIKETL